MKKLLMAASGLALASTAATAGGLDRTGQPIGIIFEEGTYAEFSFSHTRPDLGGDGVGLGPVFPGTPYNNVGLNFSSFGAGFKTDLTDKLSLSFIFENPFGADVAYEGGLFSEFGGTSATAESESYTAVLRYKFDENFSAHVGLRAQQADGSINLQGIAYGAPGAPFGPGSVNGYATELSEDFGFGYLVGVAYERPDIALRVALTYNSAITHDFDTVETFNGAVLASGGTTEVETPQSVNLDFQTGIAPDTLLFGGVRWADWSEFKITPDEFGGAVPDGLVDLDDWVTYTLGIGRRFNENWAGSISYSYESSQDPLVSPLAPTDGFDAITVAAIYTLDKIEFTTGVRYTRLGDATPETGTPDVARAEFDDNDAVTVGFKVGYNF